MANSNVNVKMGVSGIAQFKQNMQVAKNSLKTVDEQLKLNEKQFKATGDAEAYMQQKAELLNVKLEEQKAIVDQAEKALQHMITNGVDKSSKAFQDMQQQLTRARGDLIDTQMQIQGVEVASDDATAGLSDMAGELSSIGSQVSFDTVIKGIDNITDGLKNAAVKAFNFGKAIFQATLGAGSWADEVATAAKKAGLDTKTYQQMVAASQLVDTSVDSIISSQQKLSTTLESTSEETAKIFARLGIQTKRYGEIRDLNDVFWETGEALMKIQNEADRNAMGKKLFGQWRELIPLFEMGREEYEKLRDAQSYVDDEHLQSLTEMDDEYQKLQHEIEVLRGNFFAELAPAANEAMKSVSGLISKFNEFLQTEKGKEMMDSLGDNIEKLFSSITDFDPDKAIEKMSQVLQGITDAFQWIAEHHNDVSTGLKIIAGGFLAMKLTSIGLSVAQMITGFKNLLTGSTAAEAASAGAAAGSEVGTSFGSAFAFAAKQVIISAGIAYVASEVAKKLADWQSKQWLQQEFGFSEEKADVIMKGAEEARKENPVSTRDMFTSVFNYKGNKSEETESTGTAYVETTGEKVYKIRKAPSELPGRIGSEVTDAADAAQPFEQIAAKAEKVFQFSEEQKRLAEEIWDNWDDDDKWLELMDQMEALLGKDIYSEFEHKIFELKQAGDYTGEDLPGTFFSDIEETLPESARIIGENTAISLGNGINEKADVAIKAAETLAAAVASVMAGALKISSPSKVMRQMGEFVSEGFAEGIESGFGRVSDAVDSMARVATSIPDRTGGGYGNRMIDVTLMIGPDKLTEVIVPLVDNTLGEEINLMRR